MKRFRNFLKLEKWFATCFFTAIVVAIVSMIGIACCFETITLIEIVKSILSGTVLGVVVFAMLSSLYHPES